ncbi:hypothetical protein MJO28_001399 [Puccinia striiformis f. sp. tritici]|uniref:Uncharacterized protein n=1 Tax=Puccinia striiformis f. sp. tritici TaxID=168172 RepID=A0ACC0EVM9_9BASI|nr:hypothetical protein MJO28_001399 [Puccinia striiformis f. sp. tritici]
MPRARSDNIFDQPRTSYQPRVAPLESRIRQLDQLQRIQHGTDHRLLINPQLITAHRRLEEHLHRKSAPHQAANGDRVDDSMDHDFTPQKNEQPTLVNRLRDHHTDFEQQARHQSRNRRWIELIPTLHGAFISLRDETENWTTSDAFKDRLSHFCDCQHSKYRYVELVDLCGQKREFIRFCNCTPDPLWLLARGYIGSTPTAPESVFSLHLLGFHDHLWQWCNVGTQPFMKAMEAWLEERSKPLLTKKGNRRDLQVNFSASVNVYRTLMNRTSNMFIERLNLTKEQRLALDFCAACFGPSPYPPANLGGPDLDMGAPSAENEAGTETQAASSNPNEHHLAAGKNYLGLITPNNFIQPARIAQMADSIKLQERLHRIRGGHKYLVAIQRQREGNEALDSLYHKTNPFANQRSSYNLSFFEAQWASQRQFQLTHTESDRERQEQLAAFLDREASLDRLRTQLNESLANNLLNFDDIIESLLEIASGVEAQENVARTLPAKHTILIGQDLPRQRLQLMLWHSKSQLYTHAVELFSEHQPLYRGTHIGTTLSTRIMAAVDRRKKPIKSAIRKYNEQGDNRDMTYHNFINMSLDDPFWQDVYLYNSREPWACSSNVRAGIQAMLTVQRADEELSFLRDGLSTALLWAVDLHKSIKDKIEAIDAVELPEGANKNDSDDEMEGWWGNLLPLIDLGECSDAVKAQLVLNVLHEKLTKHETIMLGWAADAKAMWLDLYGKILPTHEWFNLITTLSSEASHTIFPEASVVKPNEDIAAGEEGDKVEASELLALMGMHQI